MSKRKKIGHSPLLDADPATLPPQRRAAGQQGRSGGLLDYIRAVQPGPPPFGWKDITPYFGAEYVPLGAYKLRMEASGYLLARQTVTQNGRTYRRVAVALNSHLPATKQQRKVSSK